MLEPRSVPRARRAATLIELLIALVIIGIVFGVAAFTLGARPRRERASVDEQIAALRARAADSAVTETQVIANDSSAVLVTALPDGRVLTSGRPTSRATPGMAPDAR